MGPLLNDFFHDFGGRWGPPGHFLDSWGALGALFGPRRPRTLLKSFSGAFLHKVSVSKNCFRAAKNTLPYTHFANKIRPFALVPEIYLGKYINL